ncbi:hint domain protein [Vibrio phage 1.266.O._10N.286.52.F9]|nr:hint domain protein [Vibrio phage 1.266.O._10N.286.52.F9]
MPTSQILTDAEIEHQQYLIRYSQGKANTIKPFLRDVVAYLEARLAREGESIASKKKLNALLKDTQKKMNTIYTDWEKSEFNPMFRDVVKSELEFQKGATDAVVAGYNSAVPAQKQVLSAANNTPLLIGAKGGAVDFSKYTKSWKPNEIERVNSRIVSGFYAGETTSEITRGITGLKSQNYANGILNMSRANIQSMVKTTATHLSMEAQAEFNKENSDLIIGMQWVSTLDSNTSDICRGRDGEIYYFSEYGQNYPRPPAHPNACLKGTMITTDKGLVAIEDIKVGDNVLTHTGRYMPVTTVMARKHTEGVRTLIDNFGRSVSLTDEHPILTLADGWKVTSDVKVGDVLFNNSKEFIQVDDSRSSKVTNAVLLDSHNIVTEATKELISYGIFSHSAGVSSAVNLDNGVTDNKVCDIDFTNDKLKLVIDSGRIERVNNDTLMLGGLILEVNGKAVSYLDFSVPVVGGVVSLHSLAGFFRASLVRFGIGSAPVGIASRFWGELLAGVNGVLAASGFNSKLDASLSDSVIREIVFSLNESKAFAINPVLSANKLDNSFIADHDCAPNDLWFNSTITSIVEYHIDEYVYNISVAEDETYIADGVLVHNCRSTMTPVLSPEYDFLTESRTRPAVSDGEAQEVSGKTTYYEWLNRQPAKVVDEALGPEKGKIFRNAGLTPEEYKKAATDQFGNALSIEQMTKKNNDINNYLQKQQ